MLKRWSWYLLAGVLFGVFDFYFQIWANHSFGEGMLDAAVMMALTYGIWLALAAPAAWLEARASRSVWLAAAASAFAWSVSVTAYYLFMGAQLILIGEPSRPEMHLSNRGDPFYWSNVKGFFEGDFLSGVGEWIGLALIGGCLVGLAVGWLARRVQKRA